MKLTLNRRGVLRFQQKTSRPPLTREQCSYWLDNLPKILKIGTEFEINLPAADKYIEKTSPSQCKYHKNPCITDCSNLETCLVERHPSFCKTRETGKFFDKHFDCPAKNEQDSEACKKCTGWLLNCRGLDCAAHTPFCTVCPSFEQANEENNIELSNIKKDADTIREEMRNLFQPTGSLGRIGKGILEVKKDNSLQHNGGIEIPTVGRRVHWNSFYNMSKDIIEPIVERGGYNNERCGQHYHILAGYFKETTLDKISDLEQPMPEIILANLHQLHRRYELAMFWMMSTGNSKETLTRWARFRQSIFRFGALRNKMAKVQKQLAENIICMGGANQNGKYASVAYHFCEFNEGGDVETFHIENRIADGCLSPAVITAWAMLCYALVLKAVRLSQYGIMELGNKEFVEKVKQVKPHIIDGEHREWGVSRFADTSNLEEHYPFLQELSRELVYLLKTELSPLGPSFDILSSLAERPVSLRRIDGDSWTKIENDLYENYNNFNNQRHLNEEEILEVIDLTSVVECQDVSSWSEEVAAHLGKNPEEVNQTVDNLLTSGKCRWSSSIGALITI